jgi:hypothetical protein
MVARFVTILGITSTMVITAVHSDEMPKQYIREQRTVRVQGVKETWQLVWEGKPSTVCGPDEVFMAITCPCAGYAYADYDRDGNATEFLLQVGTLPCGKLQFSAIGVSANEPHLHALTTAGKPDVPLIMPVNAWEALLKSSRPQTVTTWPCGDHDSDTRNDLVVSARNGEIRVKSLTLSCPSDNSTGKLIEETDQ